MGRAGVLIVLALVLIASACSEEIVDDGPPTHRVLFVGNSLVYYNDLPSLFRAWAHRQPGDTKYSTAMLAEAGYSLSDHLNGSQFEYELENGDYDFVILQEVGGWPLCASSDFACLEFEPRLRLIANLVRRNGAEPVWMATWHPMADAQGQLSQRVAAISERVGVRTVDTGLSLHSSDEFDALTELLAPDFHPELLGSWYLAALLLATVQENPLSIPTEELSACRHDWREHGLVATEVASGQVTSEPLCDVLSEELAARIVGDVNAALGFLR